MIRFGEDLEPEYRHAWLGFFLAPCLRNRGLRAGTIATLARHVNRFPIT